MKGSRWLLPFTNRLGRRAIEAVVQHAYAARATLVPVSLIAFSQERHSSDERYEQIYQAKVFNSMVQSIAARYMVSVEGHEVFTANVKRCITTLLYDLHCEGIVIVMSAHESVFLHTYEVRDMLLKPPASLVLIRLPISWGNRLYLPLVVKLLAWIQCHWGQQDNYLRKQIDSAKERKPLPKQGKEHLRPMR